MSNGSPNFDSATALELATAIRQQKLTAQDVMTTTLQRIEQQDPALNCFTTILADSAIAQAQHIDQAIATGKDPGPLAGVPFAAKNLFDVAGLSTLAGSKINAEQPPATTDATAIARLKQAGAILVGTLNMDEYAYGFVTENAHYGPTRNPHDPTRIAGGSSGGSAAAVAAGLVPISLGTDTNGSVRVPASLCGVWGLKPTYGRLSRSGVVFLASSLDHVGLFSRSVTDLATTFDVLQGQDSKDLVCTTRPIAPCAPFLNDGIGGLKVAIATGYFQQGADSQALEAVGHIASLLSVTQTIELPEAQRARAAAFLITAAEGGNFHLNTLKTRAQDFDPATRDRFLAGAIMPNAWYLQAQRFRRWYRDRLREIFQQVDVIITPTTPCAATPIGQTTTEINGETIEIRPNLGLYTQPISFIGLPALSVPVQLKNYTLPIGVQLIAAPYQESTLLRVAAALDKTSSV